LDCLRHDDFLLGAGSLYFMAPPFLLVELLQSRKKIKKPLPFECFSLKKSSETIVSSALSG